MKGNFNKNTVPPIDDVDDFE
jgi:hypothetical protein